MESVHDDDDDCPHTSLPIVQRKRRREIGSVRTTRTVRDVVTGSTRSVRFFQLYSYYFYLYLYYYCYYYCSILVLCRTTRRTNGFVLHSPPSVIPPQSTTLPQYVNGNHRQPQCHMRICLASSMNTNHHYYNSQVKKTWPEGPYVLSSSSTTLGGRTTLSSATTTTLRHSSSAHTHDNRSTAMRSITSTRNSSSSTTSTLSPATTATTRQRRPSSSSSSQVTPRQIIQKRQQQQQRRRQKMKPMPVLGYNARAILAYYDARPLEVGWRLNSIGFPLLGWYFRLLMDKTMGIDQKVDVQRKRGAELRQHLVDSKSVALIKSGQALSLRPDLIRNKYWAEELGKLVDAVGAFPDIEAMHIIRQELRDLLPRLDVSKASWQNEMNQRHRHRRRGINTKPQSPTSKLQKLVESDPILSIFEFDNDSRAVASASIGQVYKARIRRGKQLEAMIGKEQAARWGGRMVAIKVQRPDVEASASLDMYLLRRTAMWLSQIRGGNLPKVADAFGMQLFGELDYNREANNCDRFRELYTNWDDVEIPEACTSLTRRRVLVMSWQQGEKGPWPGQDGIEMVRIGLRCSVDQLMNTGLFHADPHRGNLLKTPDGKLALIDFGMVVDIDEDFRYSLFGLVIGLQNKDLPLVTENLLKLGFLKDTTQLDVLIPRLRQALKNATGGTGKASDVNFAQLQAELDAISRENVLRFSTPAYFTVIIRSLTILEGVALSVDKNFRLVRGAYPYVLSQLLNPEDSGRQPEALQKLLVRLLTVNGQAEEIEWEQLRDFLRLAQKASKAYDPSSPETQADDKASISRKTLELFGKFLTSRTGVFLKKPLVHELAEAIDGMASAGEANLLRFSRGLVPVLPGMNGPVNMRRMDEISRMLATFRDALIVDNNASNADHNHTNSPIESIRNVARIETWMDIFRAVSSFLSDERLRQEAGPLLEELQSVIQMVAVEILEIRGSRAMRTILRR